MLTTPTIAPSDPDCSICHEHLNDPVHVSCGNSHIFCRNCIVEWLKVGSTCPVRRVVVHDNSDDDENDEEEEEEDEEFDEEEYRDGLLEFIDQINALTPEELRVRVR